MSKLQDTAAMHAALNHALTSATRQIREGREIPWQDLEDGVALAIEHGVAEQKDLERIKNKELDIEQLKALLALVKERYGNPPKAKSKM